MLHLISIAWLLLILSPAVWSAESDKRGIEIARAADRFDQGFDDYSAEIVMTLRDRRGRTSRRDLRIRVKESAGDGDLLLFIFDTPLDVRGTVMLTHSHGRRSDDQWLYLPAVKRVKRIASGNKSGPFMGSEFAYEDLGSQELDKYDYRYRRDESCGRRRCLVLERTPKSADSGYRRQLVWLDTEDYRVVKVEYYDRRDSLLKTLKQSGFQQYLGRYWRPARMEMSNHQTGKQTRLDWKDYRFRQDLADRDFQPSQLPRLR